MSQRIYFSLQRVTFLSFNLRHLRKMKIAKEKRNGLLLLVCKTNVSSETPKNIQKEKKIVDYRLFMKELYVVNSLLKVHFVQNPNIFNPFCANSINSKEFIS